MIFLTFDFFNLLSIISRMSYDLFKVKGYELDCEQKEIVTSAAKNILVIAGAGSGKSLTIVGKIKYLIYKLNVMPSEILCISFTNDACNSLKNTIFNEIKMEIDVLTFHKLGLKILKDHNISFSIAESDLLDYIANEMINYTLINDDFYKQVLLKYFKVCTLLKNTDKVLIKLMREKHLEVKTLINSIITFIRLFKTNGYDYDYLKNTLNKEKKRFWNKKHFYFLLLVSRIFYEYESELSACDKIDFDDMILNASKLLNKKTKTYSYKYIIIDEFQDTSNVRYKLIEALLNVTGAKFMAVGDDYQSIYRFAGCDLYLFLNFSNFFPNAIVYKIQTTYRNSYQLIKVCERFIKVNKLQLDKSLKSSLSLEKPIKIVYYADQKRVFIKLLDYLYNKGIKNILILGRNNDNLNDILSRGFIVDKFGNLFYSRYNDMKLRFLTVHRSKGLEEDCVIVLSLENKIWGFPNKKSEEKVFNYVLSKKEMCPYAEERRLFYVASTRTKGYVLLLVNTKTPSVFVKELLLYSKKDLEILKI